MCVDRPLIVCPSCPDIIGCDEFRWQRCGFDTALGRGSRSSTGSVHRSSFGSVVVCLRAGLWDCLAAPGFFGRLVYPPGAGGSFWQFVWLCISLCGHCGFVFFFFFLHPSVVFLRMCVSWACMCVGGILLVEAGSCLQSGSQQSPDL